MTQRTSTPPDALAAHPNLACACGVSQDQGAAPRAAAIDEPDCECDDCDCPICPPGCC
jgi:hypothetical protein